MPTPPPTPPTPAPAPTPSPTLYKVQLDDAAKTQGAVCLDGSSPVYYFRPSHGEGARNLLLFLEGGGWCAGLGSSVGGFDSCLSRSQGGLGSSKSYGPSMQPGEGSAYLSANPETNPKFWNWNVAYAKYCDGKKEYFDVFMLFSHSWCLFKVRRLEGMCLSQF